MNESVATSQRKGEGMTKQVYGAKDLQELLGVSESKVRHTSIYGK